jgi:hypothetical protein
MVARVVVSFDMHIRSTHSISNFLDLVNEVI